MGRFLVALAALFALSGCTVVAAPEPGLSDEERAGVQDRLRDSAWQITGLPDDTRPPDPLMAAVPINEWGATYSRCMAGAGFPNYEYNGGDQPKDVTLAEHLCNVSLWPETDAGWYNTAQINYLYDYFEQSVVPCLALRGAQLTDVPTRQQFEDLLGGWHPYLSIQPSDHDRVFGDPAILRDCPPTPAGMPDQGWATLWD